MKKHRFFAAFFASVLLLSTIVTAAAPEVDATAPVHETYGTGTASSILLDGMEIAGTAAILYDATNGVVLYEQEAHDLRYPASITKVMSALLTIEAIDRGELHLEDVIVVGPEVMVEVGAYSSTQNIKEGEEIRLVDVLYCALTASANEACNVLAQAVSGSVPDFVDLMNDRAKELGMEGTHFANTHGYHNDNHYTTAYDLMLLCEAAMSHSLFREIVSTVSYTVPATNLWPERQLHETNALVSNYRYLGYFYDNATGIKTGSTDAAGLCLASSATEDGRDLIAVVLGCTREEGTTGSNGFRQFSESRRLLEWGFDATAPQLIMDATSYYSEVNVTLSEEVNYVGIEPVGSIWDVLPNDLDVSQFKREVEIFAGSIEAPVEKGQVLGTITVSNDGVEYGTLDLVAVASVERSDFLYRLQQVQIFFGQTWVRIALIVLAVLIVILVVRWLLFGGRRRKSQRRGGYTGKRR